MGLTSNTGLLPTTTSRPEPFRQKSIVDLRCDVTPAPFMLRPYAALYNPFAHNCSVLCNHPADTDAKQYVKRAKDWFQESKTHLFQEDLSRFQDGDKDKMRTPHDIVTEDMFRRYTETDSRPLTPAPTLASGKSRGSRRCLTPDQPHQRTAIVLDLRRSHSQETIYYHGHTTSDITGGPNTSPTNDRSTLPSLNLSDGAHSRLIKGQCEQLPPLASPLVLATRTFPVKEPQSIRTARKTYSRLTRALLQSLWHLINMDRYLPVSDGVSLIRDFPQVTCWKPSQNTQNMLPFLVSKPKLLPIKQEKPKIKKGNSTTLKTDDALAVVKTRRVRRKTRKYPLVIAPKFCDCNVRHLTKIVISYAPKSRKRGASNILWSMTAWDTAGQRKRMKLPSVKLTRKLVKREKSLNYLNYDTDEFFRQLENQLKALNISKTVKKQNKLEVPGSQRSKTDKESSSNDALNVDEEAGGEGRRRGKRRRKGRPVGSDRLTSAGLAAQSQQDPETQIAGIGGDSQNPSSRGSVVLLHEDDDDIVLPVIKLNVPKKTDSFLDDDILKYLHREVDEEAIETEFDVKRRYVLEEAMRTRPVRPYGQEMQALLRELKVPAISLGDWLHIPRVFSRKNAQFSLPIDTNSLETLSPMNYAARFVTLKKSKQLLYLTVLRKFRAHSYRMPIKDIEEGLILMMGGVLTKEQSNQFKIIMNWENYEEEDYIPDEIKLTLLDSGIRKPRPEAGDMDECDENTLKYRTWCGLCAICERMYGRFPSRDKDPPDGIELSDFSMIETKLAVLNVNSGLKKILMNIRER